MPLSPVQQQIECCQPGWPSASQSSYHRRIRQPWWHAKSQLPSYCHILSPLPGWLQLQDQRCLSGASIVMPAGSSTSPFMLQKPSSSISKECQEACAADREPCGAEVAQAAYPYAGCTLHGSAMLSSSTPSPLVWQGCQHILGDHLLQGAAPVAAQIGCAQMPAADGPAAAAAASGGKLQLCVHRCAELLAKQHKSLPAGVTPLAPGPEGVSAQSGGRRRCWADWS